MKKTDEAKKTVTAEMCDILVRPVITEKALQGSEAGHVTFEVPLNATKTEVKAAVEALFNVKVKSVNTVRQVGKQKRFRGKLGVRSDYKRAIVSLAKGHNIDITAGI